MSRAKVSLDHKRVRRLVWLVLAVFVLLGYSLESGAGSVHYSLMMRANTTVSQPPVILEEGNCSGTTTIYTNSTSAKVNVSVSASIWLSGWQYRKSHVINAAADAGTGYQIRIKTYYGSGTDSGENVYLLSHSRTDFGDVRFTDDDGTTLLDYWMQEKVDSDYAIFWVEVADDLSTTAQTIYLYYGKSDATTTSNLDNTFIFGQDFRVEQSISSSKWVTSGSPTISWTTDGLNMQKTSGVAHLRSVNTYDFSTPKREISEFRIDVEGYGSVGVYTCPTVTTGDPGSESNWVRDLQGVILFDEVLQKKVGGTTTLLTAVGGDMTLFYKRELMLRIASVGYLRWFFNGTQRYLSSSESLYTTTSNYLYPCVSASSGYTRTLFMKYFALAKYVDPEPSHGAYGSEEEGGSGSGSDYDYVLKVVNQVEDSSWTINLQVYDNSSLSRISSLNISLHDGTKSNQIAVIDGNIDKSEGDPYNLPGGVNSTIYIKVSNLQTTTSGTSYIYVHLKIKEPSTTTYMLYVITFEIT